MTSTTNRPDAMNLRDVGVTLDVLGFGRTLRSGRLLRSGSLDDATSAPDALSPRTIINLRRSPDRLPWFDGAMEHHPLPDRDATYDAGNKQTRKWLLRAVGSLANAETPVLVHCLAGRDRTGVLVAATLRLLGLERHPVVREYAHSDGVTDTRRVSRFLDTLGDPEDYFRRINIGSIRRNLLGS